MAQRYIDNSLSNIQKTKILTKNFYVTSYEHHTITLPCEIENLPHDLHVIWQFGNRKQGNQTVLTIGDTQLENNYRVRVITNTTDDKSGDIYDKKISIHNLEIRKLQISDSGWYECQVPTKPTLINYIQLEVLSLPKIKANIKNGRYDNSFELVCEVKNLPSRYELDWFFNEKKLSNNEHKKFSIEKHPNSFENILYKQDFVHLNKKTKGFNRFLIKNEKYQNFTISYLKIHDFNEFNGGVFKCKYDSVEAKYYLDLKRHSKPKLNIHENLRSKDFKLKTNSAIYFILALNIALL